MSDPQHRLTFVALVHVFMAVLIPLCYISIFVRNLASADQSNELRLFFPHPSYFPRRATDAVPLATRNSASSGQ